MKINLNRVKVPGRGAEEGYMGNNSSTKKYAYFNSETRTKDGERFAQIVVRTVTEGRCGLESVGFDVVHDRDLGMGYETRVHWTRAGEFKRKTSYLAHCIYYERGGRMRVKMLMATDLTMSSNYRFHIMGPVAYVQLEGDEVQEMVDRLNANPGRDAQDAALLAYARELSSGYVG